MSGGDDGDDGRDGDDGTAGTRRRRRRGAARSAAVPGPQAAPGASAQPGRPRRKQAARDSGERGLGDIVGAGHSQLGVSGALRGRDVNRPSDQDLAEAEQNLLIVRRHWTPPA